MWCAVFATNDVFTWPFRPEIAAARILFPTEGYHLSMHQFNALSMAQANTGETEVLVSVIESDDLAFLRPGGVHWIGRGLTYSEYASLPLILENSLCSTTGRWGITVSHEMHAVLGGDEGFIGAFDAAHGDPAICEDFLEDAWRGNPNAGWLRTVLTRTRSERSR
jgi:hypothetical protein